MTEKDLIEEAFIQIYPDREFRYRSSTVYSKRFSRFNANIRLSGGMMELRLSESWRRTDREIQIGLVHSLLNRLFNTNCKTIQMEFYDNFIKNTHLIDEKKMVDECLLEYFDHLNREFFFNMLDIPHLKWGSRSLVRLGSYNFNTNTIVISSLLKGKDRRLILYVMYHEMLHMKHKYSSSPKRHMYHSKMFRKEEKLFPESEYLEKELERVILEEKKKNGVHVRRRRYRRIFW